jgi:hypothetical protein
MVSHRNLTSVESVGLYARFGSITDVRFGSQADICAAKRHVRFTPIATAKADPRLVATLRSFHALQPHERHLTARAAIDPNYQRKCAVSDSFNPANMTLVVGIDYDIAAAQLGISEMASHRAALFIGCLC